MKPLEGIKVLDLTNGIPYISSMFADYGADVIKVELPKIGDELRSRGKNEAEKDGPYTDYFFRSKKSFAINHLTEKGSEVIRDLAKSIDMIVFDESSEVLEGYSLDYLSLKELNPKLIYGLIRPFGEEGPWKDLPKYDLLVMAKSGLLEKTGMPEKPTKFGFPLAYIYSSWHLTAGMLASYLKMLKTGHGSKVSCSMWQTIMELDDTFAECFFGMNTLPKRIGNGFPTTNPTDTFKCKDGWFSLSIGSDVQWLNFAKAADMSHVWGEGTVYAHDPERSMDHYFGDLDKQLVDFFSTITLEEADRICQEAVVPGGPCNTIEELVEHEQVKVRNMLIEVEGKMQLGQAAKFSKDKEDRVEFVGSHSLGQDNADILRKLGYDEKSIERLVGEGII